MTADTENMIGLIGSKIEEMLGFGTTLHLFLSRWKGCDVDVYKAGTATADIHNK